MDIEAEKQELVNQQVALENFLEHPVTKEYLRSCEETSELLLTNLVLKPPTSIESFFRREQAIGELRQLRFLRSLVMENINEVKEQIKELNEKL